MSTSIAILITKEFIQKTKLRFIKQRDCINLFTLVYEKTLKHKMIAKKIDEKEEMEFEEISNQYLDKRCDIMKNTEFKFEDVYVDFIYNDPVQPE